VLDLPQASSARLAYYFAAVDVLADLNVLNYLNPILISEKEGIEKPNSEIFHRACMKAAVQPNEAVHVGDELDCDYFGALSAGMAAVLLRRPGPDGEGEHKEEDEDLSGRTVRVASGLSEVVQYVLDVNSQHQG